MKSKLIEVAYVVENMDEAIDRWVNDLQVGPWFTGIFDVPEVTHRGNVTPCGSAGPWGCRTGS